MKSENGKKARGGGGGGGGCRKSGKTYNLKDF